MENQTPIVPPVTPQVAVEQPLPAGEVGKQSSFLTILLSVLLLLAVSIAGFFAYQTQKLVKELQITNTPTTESTSVPVATDSATVDDPTADWKTYTNEEYGFSFKYPNNAIYKITNFTGSKFSVTFSNLSKYEYTDLTVFVGNNWAFTNPKADSVKNFKVDGIDAYKEDLPLGQNPPQTLVYVKDKNNYLTMQLNKNDKDIVIDEIFDQILSTFKFVN